MTPKALYGWYPSSGLTALESAWKREAPGCLKLFSTLRGALKPAAYMDNWKMTPTPREFEPEIEPGYLRLLASGLLERRVGILRDSMKRRELRPRRAMTSPASLAKGLSVNKRMAPAASTLASIA